jgi:hypothetical protein
MESKESMRVVEVENKKEQKNKKTGENAKSYAKSK